MTFRQRVAAFWILTGICIVAVVGYSWMKVRERQPERRESVSTLTPEAGAAAARAPHVLFVNSAPRAGNGQLAVLPLKDLSVSRRLSALACDRVSYANGTGVCLAADRGVLTTYSALVFDESLSHVRHALPLKGIPSRVRVAPSGTLAAVTVFVSGHWSSGADFSTSTLLIDTSAGTVLADLEEFAITRDGKSFKAVDFNFWGVTFLSSSESFYATLSSKGVFYLIKGDVASRSAVVIGTGVECPALSPDQTRIAYKKRAADGLVWHLAVRDLRSGEERMLSSETRSIDDQVEWLDDRQILYGATDQELGTSASSIWVLDVESGAPRRWIEHGVSPAISSLGE